MTCVQGVRDGMPEGGMPNVIGRYAEQAECRTGTMPKLNSSRRNFTRHFRSNNVISVVIYKLMSMSTSVVYLYST